MSARRKPPSGFPEQVDPTVVDGPLAQDLRDEPAVENAATTVIDPPAQPIQVISKKDKATGPIQSYSMKTPGAQSPPEPASQPTPMVPRPKLRALAEVAQHASSTGPVQNLGNLAQPYDPKEARARKVREYVIWGCVAVILASVIALVVWFAAR
jgi:hypothetical protein